MVSSFVYSCGARRESKPETRAVFLSLQTTNTSQKAYCQDPPALLKYYWTVTVETEPHGGILGAGL
jgi:hypothetical protein